jgi:hypothetical protein
MIQYYETTRNYATPVLVLVAVVLAVAATTESTLAFSQIESETETEQENRQRHVCSVWTICTNEAANREVQVSQQ